MMIRTWLTILALAVGAGTSQSLQSDSVETNSSCPPGRVCRIGNNCWINGVWYNPCPEDAPSDPGPEPSPELLPPS